MSCRECEKMQDSGMVAFFRWDRANIGLIGCRGHLREVFKVLKKIQNQRLEEEMSHIVYSVIAKFRKKWPTKSLAMYDNWKDMIVDEIVRYLKEA